MKTANELIDAEIRRWQRNKKAVKDIRFFMTDPDIYNELDDPYLDKLVRQVEHINMFRETFDSHVY